MDQNSLIEIGSKVDIVLRFKSNTNVNGSNYAANEPYLYLKNVSAMIEYSNQDKTGNTDKTIIANSNIAPRTVSISNVNFSRKVISLLSTFEEENTNFGSTVFETIIPENTGGDNFLTLSYPLFNSSYYIYDENFNKIENSIDDSNLTITNSSFDTSKEYLISYQTFISGSKFNFIKPFNPYMSMEIKGIGNVDRQKKNIVMYFDKVSLNSIIDFTFIQDEIINVPLNFDIIDNKNNYIIIGD